MMFWCQIQSGLNDAGEFGTEIRFFGEIEFWLLVRKLISGKEKI